MGLGPVPLNDQLVIAIGLDVKVAFSSESNDLHCQVVRDAVVEEHLTARRPNLRALVTDDRVVQSEPSRPRHGAGERAPRASDDLDPGGDDSLQSLEVARIEVQVRVDDSAVEVEG